MRSLILVLICLSSFSIQVRADEAKDKELLALVSLGEPPTKPLNVKRLHELIDGGANVNAVAASGRTPIYSVTTSHAYLSDTDEQKPILLEAMKYLVAKGANVNVADKMGMTPMMQAVSRAYTGSLSGKHAFPDLNPPLNVLLSADPKPALNQRNVFGDTVLSYLAAYGKTELAQRLIAMGADLYVVDYEGRNLIGKTVQPSGTALFDLILSLYPSAKHKEIVNLPAASGTTILHRSVRIQNVDMVAKLLTTFGADPGALNVDDETPVDESLRWLQDKRTTSDERAKAEKIYALLLKAGGKPFSGDPDAINCTGHNAGAMSFKRLEKLIKKCKLNSVDEVLPLLPRSYLANYILIYKSRGLQTASAAFPRVVSIGTDSKFVLAFNGSSDHANYNTIETMEYKEKGKKRGFEFREITFEDGKRLFSESNPPRCLECHNSQHPRPNWDNWYLWPGVYGSEQGVILPAERKMYDEYLKNAGTGRYKNLLPTSDRPLIFQWGTVPWTRYKSYQFELQSDEWNMRVASAEIANSKKLRPYRYALLGALSCNDPIEEFLPETINRKMPVRYKDLYQQNRELSNAEFMSRIQRHVSIIGRSPEGDYASRVYDGIAGENYGQSYEKPRMAKLRYIIEGLGLPINWSTQFGKESHYVTFQLIELEMQLWRDVLDPKSFDDESIYAIYAKRAAEFRRTGYEGGMFVGQDHTGPIKGKYSEELCWRLRFASLRELF